MQILFYVALGLVLFAAATTTALQRQFDTPKAVVAASAQVDQYRLFMFIASQYMRNYSAGAGTITWDTMKTIAGAPSGAKSVGMPATWKVVAAADNSWVACTELDERAIGAIQQLAVRGGQSLNKTLLNGNSFIVVGGLADTVKAIQCN
jgi:hypothetical protein